MQNFIQMTASQYCKYARDVNDGKPPLAEMPQVKGDVSLVYMDWLKILPWAQFGDETHQYRLDLSNCKNLEVLQVKTTGFVDAACSGIRSIHPDCCFGDSKTGNSRSEERR